MLTRRKAACCLALSLLTSPARAERLPIKVYTTADGLASSVVLSIVPDSRGFLWFATRGGLSRFDGSVFRTYTTDDGLPHPVVNSFLETDDGEYWVATNGGGVCRFNVEPREMETGRSSKPDANPNSLFTCRSVGSDFASNRVNVIYEDRQRVIWVGTDNGLFRLERAGGQWRVEPVVLSGLQPARVVAREIYEDSRGRLWFGHGGGLVRKDPDGRAASYTVPGRDLLGVRGIAEHDGGLWIGSRIGLIAFTPERQIAGRGGSPTTLNPVRPCTQTAEATLSAPVAEGGSCLVDITSGLPDNHVRAVLRTPNGRLWIGTAGGLAYIEGARLTSLATAEQVGAANLDALARDRDGHLWIGTTVGAMRMAFDGPVSYGPRDGLGHPRIHTIIEDREGTIFAVSGEWVINRLRGGRFHAIRPRVSSGATFQYLSQGAFLDRTGQWWLLTDRGLYRLAPGDTIEQAAAQAVYTTRSGLSGDSVYRLFEDSRGDIWIATRRATPERFLSRWRRATGQIESIPYIAADGIEPKLPIAFAEDQRGAVWVGFEDGALARYDDGHLALFGTEAGVPREVVDLHVDRAGRLWVASPSSGLSLLEDVAADRLAFRRYTTAQGLSTNNILCLTDDTGGRIYLGSARGVDRLDPTTGRVKRLTTADGLAGDFVTAAFRDRTGALWFGTTEGLSRLVPTPDPPSVPPLVWIGEVRVGGAAQALSELGASEVGALTLRPDQNHLQIGFFGVGFGTGGPLRYRYRLDGAEPDWTGPTDRRTVHYASLAPGRYRFLVQAQSSEGEFSPRAASVSFTVLPPLWRRWWFMSLTMLVAAGCAYALHRARVARLLEVERVRARIAADLHDDIGGSLSRIAIQSEVARREVAALTGSSARRLVDIGDTARRVVESLADVVWSVSPMQDDLASVEQRVREYAADALGGTGVRWTFDGTDRPERLTLDPEARHDLLLLLKEGVTNIARHAEARNASLHLTLVGRDLHAELRDDGRGFDPAAIDTQGRKCGHGLANMRQRARHLGARLAIESEPGLGTRVLLTAPLRPRRRMTMRLWPAGR